MDISDEQLKQYHEQTNVKDVLRGGQNEGRNSLAQEILSQDKYKQQVIDGLLKIRRTKRAEKQDGEIVLQEYVRLEDGTGRWKRVSDIEDSQWEQIKQGGAVNEEGAKDVLTTLNGISNNNVSLSNLNQDQINRVGRQAVLSIDSKLRSNRETYGIDSTDDIEWIVFSIITPNVLAGLSKAKNGSLIGELLRETRLVGSLDDDDDDDSGGLLG